MKLKNTHILLIVMSIFLLLSIGSVCASEDSSADADVPLAEDGSDVVLANENADICAAKEKIKTKIVSKDVTINESEAKKISLTVKDADSKKIKITDKNITVKKENTKLNFTYKDDSITINDKLQKGKHNLVITYLGNNNYKNSTKNVVLSIIGKYTIESESTINVNQTKTVEVPLTISNGVETKKVTAKKLNVKVNYKSGNKTKQVNISDLKYKSGKLIFNCPVVNKVSSYDMTVTYTDTNFTASKKITLKKVRCIAVTPTKSKAYYQNGKFTFKVTDYYTNKTIKNATISLSGTFNNTGIYWDLKNSAGSLTLSTTKKLTSNSNGIITLYNKNFYPGLILSNTEIYSPAGKYDLNFKASGDLYCDIPTTITISKVTPKVTVEKFSEIYGTSKKVKISVVNSKINKKLIGIPVYFKVTNSTGGEIVYTNNNTKINTLYTDANGTIELPVNTFMAGKYKVYAKVNKSSNYNAASTTKTITLTGIPIKYTISKTGIITVKNNSTGKKISGAYVYVKFDKDDNKLFITQSDEKGTIKFTTVGKHKMTVSNADNRYSSSAVSKTITNSKITAKASAPKLTTYYKTDGKYFTIQLNDSKKNPIYDAKLKIRLYISSNQYYEYNGKTAMDGKIRLALDSLNAGTYKVEVTSGDTKSFSLKKVSSQIVIKKAPTKLTPTKLTAKKGESKYFKVTVENTKTKKVISGVKVKIKVYTGKKYKTYTVKTNSKGIAKLNVKSLAVGSHKVVVTSGDTYCVAKSAQSTIKITKK